MSFIFVCLEQTWRGHRVTSLRKIGENGCQKNGIFSPNEPSQFGMCILAYSGENSHCRIKYDLLPYSTDVLCDRVICFLLWNLCFCGGLTLRASLGAQWEELPTLQETRVQSLNSGSIPESGRSPGVGSGNPLLYSFLENSMDRGAWQAMVHRVAKSQQ